ncbi:hypothetical protein NF27_DN00030 [Candidatus Jidaibacter acanthamoeba]|uniref:HTH luxR-type domain-containing protein n=1 Tax=Candidatus Jidaibacter acanthamoebae TaxID=86105 RepID=A0A0C1MUB6_9RICK|nr:ester cyclase [Candidatus Jidaibacter acanthamoeba]KIE05687.1 hypothetical protein NF27_DN00030 [Candidatus Jidaibacter acanthamoeba]
MKFKKIIESFLNELWNTKCNDENALYSTFNDKVLITSPLGKKIGKNQILNVNNSWLTGFPNITVSNIEYIMAGNKVVTKWICTGKHENEFNSYAATGKIVQYQGVTIFEFESNKIVNYECYINMLDIYSQLGMYLEFEKYKNQNLIKLNYELLINELKNYGLLSLSKREIESICFFIHSKSSKEIGRILNLSYRTIETYLANAMYKIGVNSKSDLINKLEADGVIHIFRDLYTLLIS